MLSPRSGSHTNASASAPPSIEDIRRRARHRLIGAAVLVALGVLGFPLLFDTQPRPIAVDIPIEIPSRQAVVADAPALQVAPAERRAATAETSPTVPTQDSLAEREEVVVAAAAPSANAPRADTPSTDTPFARRSNVSGSPAKLLPRAGAGAEPVAVRPVAQPPAAAPAAPASRAEASAPPVSASAAPASERTIVQVGAFADAARAQEVRWRLERAGLKTYTHVAETAEGRRIRVRLGPFSSRAEAEQAAERAKALGLPAALLTL